MSEADPTITNFIGGRDAMNAAVKELGGMLKAINDVINERQRQINAEGYTAQHDDQYQGCQLSLAAAAYATHEAYQTDGPPWFWPWPLQAWKPKGERRDLVRAAALIIARIEQIDRRGA